MNVIELIILLLSASGCSATNFSVASKSSEAASLIDASVEIVSSCYQNLSNVVGLAGSLDGDLFERLYFKQNVQVAVIGNDTRCFLEGRTDPVVGVPRGTKLQIFVVTASSETQLVRTLRQVNCSQWWNHMATLIIVDWRFSKDDGCSNAVPFLRTAWHFNVLNALYLCQHRTKGRWIYSFNPYTSRAPYPWQWDDTVIGSNNHPWTLFHREYDGDERFCVNLEFDKTSDLAGYVIDVGVLDGRAGLNSTKSFHGFSGSDLYRAIFQPLNATPNVKDYGPTNSEGFYDLRRDIFNGSKDIDLTTCYDYKSLLYSDGSEVYLNYGISIITQYSGHQSQLNKLLTVLDRSTRFSLCLVIVMTFIFFKCFLRQPIGSAVLNVFRIAAYSSLTKVPKNQAARFYLAGVFILVVTIIGIYQGKLASLLTKPKLKPNVETLQDLVDRGYTIYSYQGTSLFDDPILQGRVIKRRRSGCVKDVVHDPLAGCVQGTLRLIIAAHEFKLYVSRDTVAQSFCAFPFRKNWPLKKRFNSVITALVENHIVERILNTEPLEILSKEKFYESEQEKEPFRVIVLSQLTFAFILLGIGLGCATACFIVELAVSRFRHTRD